MINNRSGFSLVEFLVAMVILMVGLLGLLQVINVAVDQNLGNVFRNEAVMVVDEAMMKKRSKAFASISANTVTGVPKVTTYSLTRTVRGIEKNFDIVDSVTGITGSAPIYNSKQITIDVSWTKKGTTYNHSATSVVSTN